MQNAFSQKVIYIYNIRSFLSCWIRKRFQFNFKDFFRLFSLSNLFSSENFFFLIYLEFNLFFVFTCETYFISLKIKDFNLTAGENCTSTTRAQIGSRTLSKMTCTFEEENAFIATLLPARLYCLARLVHSCWTSVKVPFDLCFLRKPKNFSRCIVRMISTQSYFWRRERYFSTVLFGTACWLILTVVYIKIFLQRFYTIASSTLKFCRRSLLQCISMSFLTKILLKIQKVFTQTTALFDSTSLKNENCKIMSTYRLLFITNGIKSISREDKVV